jgi:hypothetical protein
MVTRACLANAQAIKEFGPGPITNSERLQLAGAHVGVGSGVDEHNTSRGSVFVQRVGDPQGDPQVGPEQDSAVGIRIGPSNVVVSRER